MAAGDDITRLHHSAAIILALEKASVTVLVGGRSSVERDVPSFGAYHDLVAFHLSAGDGVPNCVAHGAFRALTSIVDCGVEKVDAFLQRGCGGRGISRVFGVVTLAQIGTKPEGGNEASIGKRAIEMISQLFGEALFETLGTLSGCASLYKSRSF